MSHRGWFQRILDWFYGFDFFISYRWSDGRIYALALARRLETEGFDCFLDSEEYVKGDNWKRIGERSLKQTSQLVLIASPQAIRPEPPRDPAEDPVLRELRIFTAAEKRVIQVQFDASPSSEDVQNSPLAQYLDADGLWISESFNQLELGPSDETVDDLRESFDAERQSAKRNRTLRWLVAVFAFLAIVATGLAALAYGAYRLSAERLLQSERSARVADAGRLAAESARSSDATGLSALLSIEAVNATVQAGDPPDLRAEQALRDALTRLGGQGLGGLDARLDTVSFVREGRDLFALTVEGELYRWRTPCGAEWSGVKKRIPGFNGVKTIRFGEESEPIYAFGPGSLYILSASGVLLKSKIPPMSRAEPDKFYLDPNRAWRSSYTAGRLEGFDLNGSLDEPEVSLTVDDAGFGRSIFNSGKGWFFAESFDGDTYLVDLGVENPTVLRLVSSSESPVTAATFGSSGKALVVGRDDGTIDLWTLSEGRPRPSRTFRVEQAPNLLRYRDDLSWLVVAQDDEGGTIDLIDFSSMPVVVHHLPEVPFLRLSGILEIQFSPDGRWLAIDDGLRSAGLVDLRDGLDRASIHAFHRHQNPEEVSGTVPAPVRFSPNSLWLATLTDDRRAHLWFLRSAEPTSSHLILNGHDEPVFAMDFDPTGRWLVTGSFDQTLRAWDLLRLNTSTWPVKLRQVKPDRIIQSTNPEGGIAEARFSSLGDRVLVLGESDKRELWRIDGRSHFEVEQEFGDSYPFMSNTGRWLLLRRENAESALIDLETADSLRCEPLSIEISQWSFSDNDEYLIGVDEDGKSLVWDLGLSARPVRKFESPGEEIRDVDITSDGRHAVLLTASRAEHFFWDAAGPLLSSNSITPINFDIDLGSIELNQDGQVSLIVPGRIVVRTGSEWSSTDVPDGPGYQVSLGEGLHFATTDSQTSVVTQGAKGEWRRQDFTKTVKYASAVAYRPSCDLLAMSGKGGDVFVFKRDGEEYVLQTRLPGRGKRVLAIAISPSAQLATGETDGNVRLWRRSKRDNNYESVKMGQHRGGIKCLDFSSCGEWLVSGGEDNDVFVYPMSIDRLLQSARIAIGRDLTDRERKLSFPEQVGSFDSRSVE